MNISLVGVTRSEIEDLLVSLEQSDIHAHLTVRRIVGTSQDGSVASDDIRIEIGSNKVGIFLPVHDYQNNIDWAVNGVRFLIATGN